MDFLEKDLEQIIWENKEFFLIEFNDVKFRQKRIGKYGIADFIGVKKKYRKVKKGRKTIKEPYLLINVYELKKDKVGISAFLQALGYVRGIQHYLSIRNFSDYEIKITLIGRTIDLNSTFCYMPNFTNSNLSVYTYDYKVSGLQIKQEHGYILTDHGFDNDITPF